MIFLAGTDINAYKPYGTTGRGEVTCTTYRVGETYLHISTSQKHNQGNDREMTNLNSLELLF